MADVFISYARDDKVFVTELCAALAKQEVETWVDWEGIPPTTEWMEEIIRAIDGADNFLFVISDSSVKSEVCLRELAHAQESNKRLVPVVFHEVDSALVPESLARLNWIFLETRENSLQGLDTLMDALKTDLDWVRLHSQLLVRARDWEAKNKDKSTVLRGSDLVAAEKQLVAGSEKEPKPSTLQVQFIQASRLSANRRLRGILSAVTIALVTTSGLAVLAFLGRQEAQVQSQISLSRQLAAQSLSVFEDAPDLAILLSLEAQRAYNTFEARNSIWETMDRTRHLDSFLLHPRDWRSLWARALRVGGVAFSPDGKIVAAASWDNRIEFFDPQTTERIAPALEVDDWPYCVAFSPSGHLLAVGDQAGTISFWSVSEQKVIGEIKMGVESVDHLAFSPNGQWLAAAITEGSIALLDISKNPSVTAHWRAHPDTIAAIAFGVDGTWLVSGGRDESIRFWQVPTGEAFATAPSNPPQDQFPLSNGVNHVAVHPEGTLIGWSIDEAVVLWDLASAQVHRVLRQDEEGVFFNALVFSPSGDVVAVAAQTGTIFRWRVADGEPLEPFRQDERDVDGLAFSPDGKLLASVGWRDGSVVLWHHRSASALVRELGTTEYPPYTVSFGANGNRLVVDSSRTTSVWDVDTGKELSWPDVSISALLGTSNTPALSPTDNLLALGTDSGKLTVIDTSEGELLYELSEHSGRVWKLAFGPDGRSLATADSDGLLLLSDVATRQIQARIQLSTDIDPALAFHPNGQMIAVGLEGTGIVLRDLADGVTIETFPDKQPLGVADLAFSPDGSILASIGSQDFTVLLWDVATQAVLATIRTESTSAFNLDFSPDGRILTISGGGITFIDVESRRVLSKFDGNYDDASFSPDGKTLASIRDKAIVLWDMDEESWRARLCRKANRDLTAEEWSTYIGKDIAEYRPTCDF